MALFSSIYARRELLWILALRNLRIRYKHSVLGFFWSLLTPLVFILIYAFFARMLRFSGDIQDFFQYLVTGIIIWQFLAMCMNDSLNAIIGNTNLVKKTYFPRVLLPLSTVLANLINFGLTLLVLGLYLSLTGIGMQHLFYFPLVLLTHAALCLGLALLISSLNVFFRDIEHIIGVATLAWFFMTPIFYPYAFQADQAGRWWPALFLNPMTGLVGCYRHMLMSMPAPPVAGIALSAAVAWALLGIGWLTFNRMEPRFGDVL